MPVAKKLSRAQERTIRSLAEKLPPVIARNQIEKFLGGIIAQQTLSNADASGDGPEIAYRVGKKVAYQTDTLLRWIAERYGLERIVNSERSRV